MSKKYRIIIEEVISEHFLVDATSKEEAIRIAMQKYKSGEFVLSPGNLEQSKIGLVDDGLINEWQII